MSALYDPGSLQALAEAVSSAATINSRNISELTTALNQASEDSGRMARRIIALTIALVGVGLLQVLATAWPYLQPDHSRTSAVQIQPTPTKHDVKPAVNCPVPPCTTVNPYQPNYPDVPR